MSLDLNAAKTVVENNLRGKGLTVESEIKDNRLHCNVNNTTIKDYKSDVLITVIINQNGVSTFRCVFDKIYNLESAARLINAFNDYEHGLKPMLEQEKTHSSMSIVFATIWPTQTS